MAVLRCGERVVHGAPALAFLVELEHREVDHPQRCPAVVEEAGLLAEGAVADLHAQRADGVVDDLFLVGAEEQDVAVARTRAGDDLGQRGVVQVLDDRALQAVAAGSSVVDLDVGQALGAVDLHELLVRVDFTARQAAFGTAAGHAQRNHAAAGHGGGVGEHLELDALHQLGEFGEFELHAQVGLVRAVLEHRVGVAHGREHRQVDVRGVAEHGADHAFEHLADFFFGEERGLDVDLRELRLAVGAQVFVAEALHDLVVAVVAGHHQQLLEQLGRLRQREEAAVVHAAGHEVVARAFGRGLAQHRRLDVDEAVGIEELARFHRHLVAQHHVALHGRAAQVEHAVREAGGFRQVVVVQQERGRDRGVQHLQFVAQHFDLAALEAVVGRAFGARAHEAGDLHAELVAQVLGHGEGRGAVGVAHHLHVAFAVAHVDEDHAAVVAATVDPPAQGDGLAQQGFGHKTAIVSTHGHRDDFRRRRGAFVFMSWMA
ncbi:hypothetical protein D9M72_228170 [compost metagenome]